MCVVNMRKGAEVFAYLVSVLAQADVGCASPVSSRRGRNVQVVRNDGPSEQLPAAPERGRCLGVSMVDVFDVDVDRFLLHFSVGYGLTGGEGLGEAILTVFELPFRFCDLLLRASTDKKCQNLLQRQCQNAK